MLNPFTRRVPSRDEALHETACEAVQAEAAGAFATAIKAGDRFALQIDDMAAGIDAQSGARVMQGERDLTPVATVVRIPFPDGPRPECTAACARNDPISLTLKTYHTRGTSHAENGSS